MQTQMLVDKETATLHFTAVDNDATAVIPLGMIESINKVNGILHIFTVSGAMHQVADTVYDEVVKNWMLYLKGELPIDPRFEPAEEPWTFEVDGVQMGMEEWHQLREDLIKVRDTALTANDFTASVLLSHVIAGMYQAAEKLWGNNWLRFMEK